MVNSYSVVFRNSPHSYSVIVRFGIVLFRNSPISYSVVVRSGICRSVPPPLGHNGICQNGKKSPFYTFDSSQNVQKSSQKSFCRCGICRSGRLQAGQNGIYMPLWHMPLWPQQVGQNGAYAVLSHPRMPLWIYAVLGLYHSWPQFHKYY